MTYPTKLNVAPGSTVVVRDEEWMVTGVEHTVDGWLLRVQGLSELVRDTTAAFYEGLDHVEMLDPAEATLVADASPGYRRSRLWLEATLRKTAMPMDGAGPTVSTRMLADALGYQQAAVSKALDPANLRTRILLADAVGLGKTLEIGMILSELTRRGRGDRILIVSPRHVLEQMQHEMWSRFAIPFVRLDSLGIQRVRQKLPATRNPFTYFKRVIISIDTLKSDRYLAALRKHQWDAVVIDESHNITNSATQNNRLAKVLAPNTEALILASATPHNGRAESFAELIRLLEPTAVRPDGTVVEAEASRLIVRRHRHSPEVASEVGANWAERKEPQNWLVPASQAENAVAQELDEIWLHPAPGRLSPYSGTGTKLFPWTLAKAFLSSPAALAQTLAERIRRIGTGPTPAQANEIEALRRLEALTIKALAADSAKYLRLVAYLRQIGVGPDSAMRVVVFAERVPTLKWLRDRLPKDLRLKAGQVGLMHGGLTDEDQQAIVESFKQASSPIRVLVTGDVASEGVNLHTQCHQLIHFDLPWSLIRIEQRNGRIDRYGQKHSPQITTLLLDPETERFSGDIKVLSRLIEKEHEAHAALGDVGSLMGKYDPGKEEDEIRKVLAGEATLDEVVGDVSAVGDDDPIAGMLAMLGQLAAKPADRPGSGTSQVLPSPLYAHPVDFLREALHEAYPHPEAPLASNGVRWREHEQQSIVELAPPADLRQRLDVLPQSYLAERRVMETFKLATNRQTGKALLTQALADQTGSSWPEAHYLGPLHPVVEWAADRALSGLGRNQIFAARGTVDNPTVVLLGTLTNRRGQVVASAYLAVEFPNPANPRFRLVQPHESAASLLQSVGVSANAANPGGPAGIAALQPLVSSAVATAQQEMAMLFEAAQEATQQRVDAWSERATAWEDEAGELQQRALLKQRRLGVHEERVLAAQMAPDRQLVRPLLLVLPADHPVKKATEGDWS